MAEREMAGEAKGKVSRGGRGGRRREGGGGCGLREEGWVKSEGPPGVFRNRMKTQWGVGGNGVGVGVGGVG